MNQTNKKMHVTLRFRMNYTIPNHCPFTLYFIFLHQADSKNDPGEISQVEDIVRFSGGG